MIYAKLDQAGNVEVYPYTMNDFRKDFSDVLIRDNPPEDALIQWGVVPVLSSDAPEAPIGQKVQLTTPVLINGQWAEQWELVPAPVPWSVSMAQARIALKRAGLLSQVEAAIAAIPDEGAREEAELFWEYATEVQRTNSLIQSLGPLLGLSEEEIDMLFHVAKTIN